MAPPSLTSLLGAAALLLASAVEAAIDPSLVGTWSTKSGKVLTGPAFYNPSNDSFIEPALTGISYSFTTDGFYEEAYYRAISNPTNPACPQGILQFQHGSVEQNTDGSLSFTPIAVDGRQLLSNPCMPGGASTYSRYNQSESMSKFQVSTDAYYGVKRLDLYQFDGTPVNPMYLAASPPVMLPTQTLNPTSAAASATAKAKAKRDFVDGFEVPLNKDAKHIKRTTVEGKRSLWLDVGVVWWLGVGMTVLGGAAYLL